ncbi:hypothetical protein R75777_03659 [Paraburkholderia nemoris]|nr:hypothetical protein R75777_03659 [Paraburkholderia nemoris]
MVELDHVRLDIPCPRCRFLNGIRYRDARLRDVLICRGCKSNIRLDDSMNECRKARRSVRAALDELEKALGGLSKNLTVDLHGILTHPTQ